MSLADRMRKHRHRFLPKRKRAYARFYGTFKSLTGKKRFFEFQVRVSRRTSGKALYRLIVHTVNKLKYEKQLPYHQRRQTFASFHRLFNANWIRIRGIVNYDADVFYPTPFGRR